MDINGATALVTGANRGIGKVMVRQLLDRGASKVYATARSAETLAAVVAFAPDRVVAMELDITKPAQVAAAALVASDIDLLINNAGYAPRGGVLEIDLDEVQQALNTNLFGNLRMTREFAPLLVENGGGAIVTILSMLALAPIPRIGGYAVTKAALESATISMRSELAAAGVAVHAVYPALIDTDMAAGIDGLPKADPESVISAVLDGVEAGDLTISPDDVSQNGYATWLGDPRGLQEFMAAI